MHGPPLLLPADMAQAFLGRRGAVSGGAQRTDADAHTAVLNPLSPYPQVEAKSGSQFGMFSRLVSPVVSPVARSEIKGRRWSVQRGRLNHFRGKNSIERGRRLLDSVENSR